MGVIEPTPPASGVAELAAAVWVAAKLVATKSGVSVMVPMTAGVIEGVAVLVTEGLTVPVGVTLGETVPVGVNVDVIVPVEVGVGETVCEPVAEGVGVNVDVTVPVEVGVEVLVGEPVTVGVGVSVGVLVMIGIMMIGVLVGPFPGGGFVGVMLGFTGVTDGI